MAMKVLTYANAPLRKSTVTQGTQDTNHFLYIYIHYIYMKSEYV